MVSPFWISIIPSFAKEKGWEAREREEGKQRRKKGREGKRKILK